MAAPQRKDAIFDYVMIEASGSDNSGVLVWYMVTADASKTLLINIHNAYITENNIPVLWHLITNFTFMYVTLSTSLQRCSGSQRGGLIFPHFPGIAGTACSVDTYHIAGAAECWGHVRTGAPLQGDTASPGRSGPKLPPETAVHPTSAFFQF